MTGIKFLPVLVILVSGYITCKSTPSLKRSAIKSNGQQLTLNSAIAGLIIFMPVYLFCFWWVYDPALVQSNDPALVQDKKESAESLVSLTSAAITFVVAISIFVFNKALLAYNEFMMSDSPVKSRVAKVSQNKLQGCLYQTAYLVVQKLHWYSYLYTVYSARQMIKDDHIEELFLNSMLQVQSGLCMFVMESQKVVIGNVAAMPDPASAKTESYVRVLPYFTGHLCDDHLQLHITTDYTHHIDAQRNGEAHQNYSFDVVLPSSRITYVREFDRDFFKESFINKSCPCGHKVYNTRSGDRAESSVRLRGFRAKCRVS
ncbi:hypothetical protein [Halomonas salinarum]|uniref:hypothetical protein n=1 Tax=Halomonas salinarum TaxID=1158993 RepID=UPI00143AAA25|nr:hypothetical protein [Halomonas salinarum]